MWCIECSVGVVFFVLVAGGVVFGAAADEVPFAAVAVAAFAVTIVDEVVESVVVAPIDIAAAAATYIFVEFAKEPAAAAAAVAAVTATDLPLQPPLDELPLSCYPHSNQAMP